MTRYKIEVGGKTAYLSEEQHKQLLDRFDIETPNYTYERPCLCKVLLLGCRKCPFDIWVLRYPRCTLLGCWALLRILGLKCDELVLTVDSIRASKEGLEQAKAIHDWLASLPEEVKSGRA